MFRKTNTLKHSAAERPNENWPGIAKKFAQNSEHLKTTI